MEGYSGISCNNETPLARTLFWSNNLSNFPDISSTTFLLGPPSKLKSFSAIALAEISNKSSNFPVFVERSSSLTAKLVITLCKAIKLSTSAFSTLVLFVEDLLITPFGMYCKIFSNL